MNPTLERTLESIKTEIRVEANALPVLYWLRAYATLANEQMARGETLPRVRWAKLSGYVARTAREFGLNGLDRAPGQKLVTGYGLFQAAPEEGGTPIRERDRLRELDWRAYSIELVDEYQTELAGLRAWCDEAWKDLRETTSGALAAILARWAPEGRSGLLPALIEAQEQGEGWVSRDRLAQIANALHVPLSEAYGVATYYSMVYTEPVGRKIIRVCDDVSCYLQGSRDLVHKLRNVLWLKEGQTSEDGNYTLETVPCLGHCERAPVMMVGAAVHEQVTDQQVDQVLRRPAQSIPQVLDGPVLLKGLNGSTLDTLDGYLAAGGFVALSKALAGAPEQIIAEVKAAGLVGRGGAAFPTGLKWELTANAVKRARTTNQFEPASPRLRDRSPGYVVCNADESETGTFKDRVLLERNPFRVIEGILIAARAVGVTYGYIYVRGEYPLAYERLRAAVEQAHARNYLGDKILGSDFSFDLEIRRGAGAYECGEETALFESIEGKRGEPRTKPPFPTDVGLFGRPTAINNVETLANVPFIVTNGASAYRQYGTEKSPGTRLVCLSGQVRRAGVYEISMGTSLREVIYELGGGLEEGRSLKTVLVGGAAGAFLTPDQIDVPLAFESLAAIGATFGSGAIMVLDDRAEMWQVLKRIAHFFKDESCGKCFPCQIGTQRQLEIIERMGEGKARAGDRELLFDVGQVMTDASLCGLGQFAATAITSAFKKKLVVA